VRAQDRGGARGSGRWPAPLPQVRTGPGRGSMALRVAGANPGQEPRASQVKAHGDTLRDFAVSTKLCTVLHVAHFRSGAEHGIFPPKSVEQLFPAPSLRSPRFIRSLGDRLAGSCAVTLRCPLTPSANGQQQQHSSSYFVCNPQYHGLVQGGALAPATGRLARARCMHLFLHSSLWAPLPALSTKEMRIGDRVK
jgi:hypothetical protein